MFTILFLEKRFMIYKHQLPKEPKPRYLMNHRNFHMKNITEWPHDPAMYLYANEKSHLSDLSDYLPDSSAILLRRCWCLVTIGRWEGGVSTRTMPLPNTAWKWRSSSSPKGTMAKGGFSKTLAQLDIPRVVDYEQ